MKILLKNCVSIFVLAVFLGCDKTEITSNDNFKIEYGSECGWCAGQEFIKVTNSQIEYTRNIPCGDNKGLTQKSKKISTSEWNEIISSFDYSLFKTLNYNTCNVCVDGCDEIIKITESGNTHELRYSESDEIEEIQNLRQILNSLMQEMRKLD